MPRRTAYGGCEKPSSDGAIRSWHWREVCEQRLYFSYTSVWLDAIPTGRMPRVLRPFQASPEDHSKPDAVVLKISRAVTVRDTSGTSASPKVPWSSGVRCRGDLERRGRCPGMVTLDPEHPGYAPTGGGHCRCPPQRFWRSGCRGRASGTSSPSSR